MVEKVDKAVDIVLPLLDRDLIMCLADRDEFNWNRK